MIDKVVTVSREKIGQRIGEAEDATMQAQAVGEALAAFLGL